VLGSSRFNRLAAKIGRRFEHQEKLQSLVKRKKELEDALDITKNQASNVLAAEETEVQTVKETEGESVQESVPKYRLRQRARVVIGACPHL
jgi:hypothetical protein